MMRADDYARGEIADRASLSRVEAAISAALL